MGRERDWKNSGRMAVLGVRTCTEELHPPTAVMDGFRWMELASFQPSPKQTGAVRKVVLAQVCGNTTQPGSGPVNQARWLMAFQVL